MNDLAESAAERAFVYAVVRRILRDEDAASDATQDALLLAHRHRGQFRGDASIRTWLYRIAVTTALGALRKARRSREQLATTAEPLGWAVADAGPSPEQEVAARQLARTAELEVGGLGAIYQRVFALKADEWAEREIADALAISLANVKIRTHRVRRHLREALGGARAAARRDHDARAAARRDHDARPVSGRAPRGSRPPRGSRAGSTATTRPS